MLLAKPSTGMYPLLNMDATLDGLGCMRRRCGDASRDASLQTKCFLQRAEVLGRSCTMLAKSSPLLARIAHTRSLPSISRASSFHAMVAQQQRTTVDAVVLGGGWAGLTAALRLVESDKIVTLIEARPRLGGRAFTHTYDESSLGSPDRTVVGKDATDAGVTAIDFGCSWVHGYAEGNPVREICKDLGIVSLCLVMHKDKLSSDES